MSLYKKYRVVRKVKESDLVTSLYLQPADNTAPLLYKPGQHLLFKINIPGQEVPLFRHYSFSDAYDQKHYRISVKKEPSPQPGISAGQCSSWLCDILQEGDVLEAKGPVGDFVLDTRSDLPLVFIAGGIGITPLLSMIKSVAIANPLRRLWLFYGVNKSSEHSFFNELSLLKKAYPAFHIHTFYTTTNEQDKKGVHYDEEGFVDAKTILRRTMDVNLLHYMCGPPVMMKHVSEALMQLGVPRENILMESFIPVDGYVFEGRDGEKGKNSDSTGAFYVEFVLSGKRFVWDDHFRSILEFAETNDIAIDSGCLFGDCGTCLTRLVGEVKYTHATMVTPDKGHCLPCSCVPVGNISLNV